MPDPPEAARRRLQAAPPLSIPGLEWARATGDRAALARMAGSDRSSGGEPLHSYLAAVARGYLALIKADTATAVEALAAAPDSVCECHLHRLQLVRALLGQGDRRRAGAALSREMRKLFGGPISQILWELERGRLAELDGRTDDARRAYQYVSEVWRAADPELAGFVSRARAGLERLSTMPLSSTPASR
jgi:hypothetical protein